MDKMSVKHNNFSKTHQYIVVFGWHILFIVFCKHFGMENTRIN